ncbi:MAG: hypothetical protein QOJ42_2469, partial [Acidobacteriaceae bacterium]|nr:hypothetical protein [Acidobacteriaceae bacterium]
FKLALRQTQGLMTSVLRLMGLTLSAPDHSTVSRRAVTLPLIQPAQVPHGPLNVLIDSTGLQVYGAPGGNPGARRCTVVQTGCGRAGGSVSNDPTGGRARRQPETGDRCDRPHALPTAEAIGPTLQGKTERQKNPHPRHSLAWLSWIIARLGGWNCYYKPPGPKTMRAGRARFATMAAGFTIAKVLNAESNVRIP